MHTRRTSISGKEWRMNESDGDRKSDGAQREKELEGCFQKKCFQKLPLKKKILVDGCK